LSHAVKTKKEDQKFIGFASPNINEEEIQEVVECLRSGWLATGPRVQAFETALKEYTNAPYMSAVSHATGGLYIALKALNLEPGSEVITTPMTFVATANVIVEAGLIPVFVDIDPKTYNMDVSKVEAAVTPKTKAIMPVHFDGLPVDMDPLLALAEKYDLRIIEDAAHAIGAQYKGKDIGSFGHAQVFSFHPNKNMTTAEGGAVSVQDADLYNKINMLRFHGIDRAAWNRYGKGGSQFYDVPTAALKFNMSDVQAAIGIHQLKKLDKFLERRLTLVERYKAVLGNWDELILPQAPDYDHKHAWHQFAIILNPDVVNMSREEFIQKMGEFNIGIGVQYCAVHLYSFYQKQFGYKEGDFKNAEFVGNNIVSLPLVPHMSNSDQDRVIDALKQVLRS